MTPEEVERLKKEQRRLEGHCAEVAGILDPFRGDGQSNIRELAKQVMERLDEQQGEIASRDAEIDRLTADLDEAVGLLEWLDRKGGMGLDCHERIRVFLASKEKGDG